MFIDFFSMSFIEIKDCDQTIQSTESTGMIYSPNFFRSYPINASCKYIFEGVNDNFNFESIKLNFYLIDIKQSHLKNM